MDRTVLIRLLSLHSDDGVMKNRSGLEQSIGIATLGLALPLSFLLRSDRPLLLWMFGVVVTLLTTAAIRGLRQVRELMIEDVGGAVIQAAVWVAYIVGLLWCAWAIITRTHLFFSKPWS